MIKNLAHFVGEVETKVVDLLIRIPVAIAVEAQLEPGYALTAVVGKSAIQNFLNRSIEEDDDGETTNNSVGQILISF